MDSVTCAPPTETEQAALATWQPLVEHARRWWYEPDVDAWRLALAVAVSHYDLDLDPVNLFVIGASGSSKTSLIIESLAALPETHLLSHITEKAFLSSYGTKKGERKARSLLHRIGSGILLLKDFTTFLSQREDLRAEIAAAFREIADGRYIRESGMGESAPWEGKITVIAASTHVIENQWMVVRSMGDRFTSVYLAPTDGVRTALQASAQSDERADRPIKTQLRTFTSEFVKLSRMGPHVRLTTPQREQLAHLAAYCALLRSRVVRNKYHRDEIVGADEPETPARISKSLVRVVSSHARLFGRTSASDDDMRIGRRLGLSSMPRARQQLMAAIPSGDTWVKVKDAHEMSGLAHTTAYRTLDELREIKALDYKEEELYGYCRLSERLRGLRRGAGL